MTRHYAAILVALFAVTPFASAKKVEYGPIAMLAGMAFMVLVYGLRDVIHAVRGRKEANEVIVSAALARLVVWGLLAFVALLPGPARQGWEGVMLDGTVNLVAAEISLLSTQRFVDPWLFDRFAEKSFASRYLLSNFVSQTLALVVFLSIRHAGAALGLAQVHPLTALFLGGLLLRTLVAPVLLTPLFSLLVRWSR